MLNPSGKRSNKTMELGKFADLAVFCILSNAVEIASIGNVVIRKD